MHSDTLQETDRYSAERSTAARVSLADMEAKIATEHYMIAGRALDAMDGHGIAADSALHILTLCFLEIDNGFIVVGKSAPASPENFDIEKGRRFAYEDAIKQLWPLMGFALREKLSG